MARVCDNALEAKYVNYLEVGHNSYEFRLDFGQDQEGGAEPRLHSRLITNPVYAKSFLEVLQAAVNTYELSFGKIRTPPTGGIETGSE
jgi:hypothetical protein